MRSIVFKLAVIMLCITFLSVIITVSTAIFISGNSLQEMAHDRIEAETATVAHELEGWLNGHVQRVSGIANILTEETDFSDDNLRPMFIAVNNDNSDYNDVYMGFADDWAVMASGVDVSYLQEELGWMATNSGWYQLAMTNTNITHVTQPYIDTASGELCITAARAVKKDGQAVGVFAVDILLPEVARLILSQVVQESGYAMLLDANGNVLVHPGEYAPNVNTNTMYNFATMADGVFSDLWSQIRQGDGAFIATDAAGVQKYYTSHTLEFTDWKLLTVVPSNDISRLITQLILIIAPITLAIMIVASIIIVMTTRSVIAKPLAKITKAAEALAVGDIEIEDMNPGTGPTKNEVTILERAFVKMIESIKKQAYVLARIAEGDYTESVEIRSEKDVINSAIELVLDGTLDVLGQVANAGISVAESSQQISQGANTLALGAADQAATVEQLSATMSVIADKTKDNAGMAGRAATLANTIKDKAEEGSRQMDEMMSAVKDINQASQDIGNVIKVIDDIAFQTNILALNAAVEAARAGQHGKGFAVVAEEVRNLAAKSADAAKNSEGLISASMQKAELGTRIAGETSESLSKIVDGINESTKIVSDIAASSEEQTMSIDQINTAIEQVAQVVQQNSLTAERSADASKAMTEQSDVLKELIRQFQLSKDMRGPKKSLPPKNN